MLLKNVFEERVPLTATATLLILKEEPQQDRGGSLSENRGDGKRCWFEASANRRELEFVAKAAAQVSLPQPSEGGKADGICPIQRFVYQSVKQETEKRLTSHNSLSKRIRAGFGSCDF